MQNTLTDARLLDRGPWQGIDSFSGLCLALQYAFCLALISPSVLLPFRTVAAALARAVAVLAIGSGSPQH